MPSTVDTRPHVVVIHRWVGSVADYAASVDHSALRVTYVVPVAGRRSYPADLAFDVEEVRTSGRPIATDGDLEVYAAAVERLQERVGPVDRLVALHEGDLVAAAVVRERLGIAGARVDDVLPFRDKVVMARRLEGIALPVPVTEPVRSVRDVRSFAAAHGWPVFVKERGGTGSAGSARYDGPADLDGVELPTGSDLVVQPFVAGDVLHVDGFWTGTALGAWTASRYVSTCFGFESGTLLGSVEIDAPQVLAGVERATTAVLDRLATEPTVFHLELFARDGDESDLVFLEIAARVGGAEIPYLWREVHGLDLVAVAAAVQLGEGVDRFPQDVPRHEVAGWLILPPSSPRPCRVTSAPSQRDRDGVIGEVLPAVGSVMPDVGGYELTGARFRLRGPDSDSVRRSLDALAAGFRLETEPVAAETLILLGSGAHLYREYGFAAIAGRARIVLLDPNELGWQERWVDEYHRIDRGDPDATAALASALVTAAPGAVGIMTWDETLVDVAARLAEEHGLPGTAPDAVEGCRDKLRTRTILAAAGVSPVAVELVSTTDEAAAAAARIGYPVVLKPRSLAASVGVVRVDRPDGLAAAFTEASSASYHGLEHRRGVLVEQFLDGPEISVDCIVQGGRVRCVNVARKRLGPDPYFEEVGHLVEPWSAEPWWPATERLLQDVHHALGHTHGITHAEVRLTAAGPRLVELNCRLGGDLIPYLGQVANGVDLVGAALDLAFGRTPPPTAESGTCAEVSFVYPDEDCVVEHIDVSAVRRLPGVRDAHVLADPGQVLRLPPRGVVPRAVALVVEGASAGECAERLAMARALVVVKGSALPEPVG